jgi:NAD-dependent deacetylase
VDGLHQRAGSRNILELHGNITRVKCFDRGHPAATWDESGERPPRCPQCGSYLRPDVVWFGEALPAAAWDAAEQAAGECDVFLSVGTSTVVYPAANLPFAALERGATVVEVNPEATPLTQRATFVLPGLSGVVLPELAGAW